MRKGRLAVVTVFGSLAVGLAACTVLSGRVYNSVLYDIVPWLVTGMVCVIPTVLCGKLETPRLSKCRNGCMQLFVFCVSTVLTIIYTDKWENVGISYIDSDSCGSSCVLEWNDPDISDVRTAWYQMERDRSCMWHDTGCKSGRTWEDTSLDDRRGFI